MIPKIVFWLSFTLLIIGSIRAEYFTALVHLEKLLQTEKHIVDNLNRYLNNEEKRLTALRHLAHHYNTLHLAASVDSEAYLSNPINAYLLVKRLTTDWKLVEYFTNTDRKDLIEFLDNETFPSSEDLSGE